MAIIGKTFHIEDYAGEYVRLFSEIEAALIMGSIILLFKGETCILIGSKLEFDYPRPWSDWKYYYKTAYDAFHTLNLSKLDESEQSEHGH